MSDFPDNDPKHAPSLLNDATGDDFFERLILFRNQLIKRHLEAGNELSSEITRELYQLFHYQKLFNAMPPEQQEGIRLIALELQKKSLEKKLENMREKLNKKQASEEYIRLFQKYYLENKIQTEMNSDHVQVLFYLLLDKGYQRALDPEVLRNTDYTTDKTPASVIRQQGRTQAHEFCEPVQTLLTHTERNRRAAEEKIVTQDLLAKISRGLSKYKANKWFESLSMSDERKQQRTDLIDTISRTMVKNIPDAEKFLEICEALIDTITNAEKDHIKNQWTSFFSPSHSQLAMQLYKDVFLFGNIRKQIEKSKDEKLIDKFKQLEQLMLRKTDSNLEFKKKQPPIPPTTLPNTPKK